MGFEKRNQAFDEAAKEAAVYLLEQFWVLRDKEPEKYRLIRDREQVLRTYFFEKTGFRLILHRAFARLEKVPAQPEPWMGIQAFKQTIDYVLLCCLMAFLENKTVDEQFLLSDLCEEIQGLYPGDEGLDWTRYEHRKAMVRVLQFAAENSILKVVDGDVSDFNYTENHEVLYEVPLTARYFLRSFPKDLFQFETMEQILAAEAAGEGERSGVERRHRVYRMLLLTPGMIKKDSEDPDFLYLRNFRNRIREDIEKHTEFQFELYKNTALLSMTEHKARYTLFPDSRAICDIALQFASVALEQLEGAVLQPDGSLYLTPLDYLNWVKICHKQFAAGWSKEYREKTVDSVAEELLELLTEWKMAVKDEESGAVFLYPLLARTVGRYPRDFDSPSTEPGSDSMEGVAFNDQE